MDKYQNSRTQAIFGLLRTQNNRTPFQQEDILEAGEDQEDSEQDDSDADPTWFPSPEGFENSEIQSSPLTDEQRVAAEAAENFILEDPYGYEDMTAQDGDVHHNGVESEDGKAECSKTLTNQVLNNCVEEVQNEDSLSKEMDTFSKNYKTKRNWCRYCSTFQSKIGRHIAAKHKDCDDVKKYLSCISTDKKLQIKERRAIAKKFINTSNNVFNKMVINNETSGKPIPVRVNKNNIDNTSTTTTHAFCSGCKGLFNRRYFSKHTQKCSETKSMNVMNESKVEKVTFEPTLDTKYNILKSKVLNGMNKDKLYTIIIQDQLILEFGRRFLKGHMDMKQKNYVGSKMRSLAFLFLKMNSLDKTILSFKDCLQPHNFNTLCTAVQQWSRYNEDSGTSEVGSVPRRICKSLKMCSYITVSESLRSKNITSDEQLKVKICHQKFNSLMENDWPIEINCSSDKSLKKAKVAKDDKMPEEKDLVAFFENMTLYIDEHIDKIKKTGHIQDYNRLTKTTLAYLIAFNCRRPSEVAYATLEHYNRVQFSNNDIGDEKLAVFTVPATKNDIKVSIIVPYIAQQAINVLLKFRELLNIQGNFLFGRQNGTPYNGSHILTLYKNEMSLLKPKDFTANGLRHYWATKSQSDPEIKRLMPKFLGHTLATHQKHYELPSNDINLNVIGPLLVAHNKPKPVTDPPDMSATNNDYENGSFSPPDYNFTPPKKSSCSVTSSPSPLPIRQKNKWITPERKELLQKLPNTMLGLRPAVRGEIEEGWRTSKTIRKRHSLQTMRIEVSKYYTNKKRICTPEKKLVLIKKERIHH